MKKYILITLLTTNTLLNGYELELKSGWNIISFPAFNNTYTLGDLKNNLGTDNLLSLSSFKNTGGVLTPQTFIFNTSTLNINRGYWLKLQSDVNITIEDGGSNAPLFLNMGWNLIGLSSNMTLAEFKSQLNSSYTFSNISSFKNTNGVLTPQTFIFNTSSLITRKGYWVKVSSINYDTFIANALTADPDLTTYTTENLNDKSIVVMENSSDSLKTSLITFNNGGNFKEVILSSFTPSTLNGSDSDINSTISSQVSSISTGKCGDWNWNGADLTMTPIDDTNTSQAVIADSSDGNFTTVVDSVSTYKKVVWYGDAIDLSSVSDCTIDGLPAGTSPSTDDSISPPSIPGSK